METSIGPVFLKCPKCLEEDQYFFCLNCQKFDEFELVQKTDGSRAAKCSCGKEITEVSCKCGAVIYDKFFYQNQNLAQEIQKHKKEIVARHQKVSFIKHWVIWTIGEFIVLLIFVWPHLVGVYLVTVEYDPLAAYIVSAWPIFKWTLFSSWLPASISWRWVVHKTVAGRASPEEKGGN